MLLFCAMAFLRVDKKSSGNYLYIAESYRDETGTSKSRILYHLGKLESYDPIELQKIAERLYCVARTGQNLMVLFATGYIRPMAM